MEKKDSHNKDIGKEKEQEPKNDVPGDEKSKQAIEPEARTEIKNAHASGLGAIGREEEGGG